MTRIVHTRLWPASLTRPHWLAQGVPYQGIVPILAATVIAFVLTRSLWNSLEFGQVYHDLVVGGISWQDADKTRDFRGLGFFIGTLAVASVGISLLVTRVIAAARTALVRPACDALLVFAMLPALWRFGVVGANPFVKATPKDSAIFLIVACFVLAILPRFRDRLTAEAIVATGGRILLGVGLAMFAGLGIGLALTRLVPSYALWLARHDDLFSVAPMIVAGVAGILLLARSQTLVEADRWLDRLLVLLQIPLPFLVFAVLPSPQIVDDQLMRGNYQPALAVLLFAYVGLALALSCVQWYRARRTPGTRSWREVCAPLCLAGIAVFVFVPSLGVPCYWRDLFQAGEELLPWQQWSHFGKLPFVDFAPIHGLMPLMRGFIAEYFFTDSAAEYFSAQAVMMGMGALATYLALHYTAGPLVALFLTAFTTPLNDRFFFLTPAIVILAWPYLLERPRRWLACWLGICAFMVFYNASLGSALTIGTSPAAAWMAYRLWRYDRRALAQLLAGVAFVALLGLAIMPVREMTFGLMTFIRENAQTNELVSGIPWQTAMPLRDRYPVAGTSFQWEVLRLSWLIVVAVALVQLWRRSTGHGARDRRLLWFAAMLPLTLLLASAWSLNRIDPGHLSRTGEVSRVAVGYLLPLLFLLGRPLVSLPMAVAGLAVLGGFVVSVDPYEGQPPLASSLAERAFKIRSLPPEPHMVHGAKVGLPRLGHIRIEEHHLKSIQELKVELDRLLEPGETYFDLTSNSAYYYYLDREVPSLYSAHYVAANSQQQRRMLEQLRADLPPVVMIAPRDDHDGGPPPLRSYLLFREFALKYVCIERGKFVFLVDQSRAPEAGPPGSPEQIALIEKHVGATDIAQIAAAWGRNWEHLSDRFEPFATLEHEAEPGLAVDGAGHPKSTAGTPLMLNYSLGERAIAGAEVEYLLIRLKNIAEKPSGPTRVAYRWSEAGGAASPGTWLTASCDTLLVPLGASPRWLLSKQLSTLHLEIHPNHGSSDVVVEEVCLLRRKPTL
ncbi:MAG: hypothetical protein KF708_19280 [Pirellulales bacterium]|nr:hypothetical protein [Pirellulales bacterium]